MKIETGFYKVIVDGVFTIAELNEFGWNYIEGLWSGVPDEIGNKISEQLFNHKHDNKNVNKTHINRLCPNCDHPNTLEQSLNKYTCIYCESEADTNY